MVQSPAGESGAGIFAMDAGRMKHSMDHLIKQDAFAKLLGIDVVELSPGHARVRMTAGPQHCNGLGIVHGGTIFSLADFAFSAACNSHGFPTVGINANMSYVKAAAPGLLFAEARELSSAKVGVCEVRVTNESGELIATFQGLTYRKRV
jgi:acyl-CoA thioesterase